jgi:hypothetical protein
MPSKSGKGRSLQDAIDSIHTDSTLTDAEKSMVRQSIIEGSRLIGAFDQNVDKTVTATYNIFRGANPSYGLSIVT